MSKTQWGIVGFIILIIAIVAGNVCTSTQDAGADDTVVFEIPCPKGFEHCYGTPLESALHTTLGWCNPAQEGSFKWVDGVIKFVRDDRHRVLHFDPEGDGGFTYGAWETENERLIRLELGGFVYCPKHSFIYDGVKPTPVPIATSTPTPTATPIPTAVPTPEPAVMVTPVPIVTPTPAPTATPDTW